ncbi:MAG: Hsp70 family protein, partial [Methyloprofundus sp.]|nr:Hsp70 family protein [Methyloprofundus sp.]
KTSSIYSTVVDNQTEIKISITEGESEDLNNNIRILADQTINIPPYPEGAPVEVFFEYDADGIVHVKVFDLTAKKMLGDEIIIDRKDNFTEDEVNSKKDKISKIQVN